MCHTAGLVLGLGVSVRGGITDKLGPASRGLSLNKFYFEGPRETLFDSRSGEDG